MSSPPTLSFDSKPAGATVTLDDGRKCKTPCELVAKPAHEQEIEATFKGRRRSQTVYRRIAYPFWANVLLGWPVGVIGAALDWYTDAVWAYDYDRVSYVFGDDEDQEEPGDSGDSSEPGATKQQGTSDASPATQTPVKPSPPAGEQNVLAPQGDVVLPEGPALKQLRQDYPKGYLEQEIGYYYGAQTAAQRQFTVKRLYKIMLDMQASGERPDVDEAVRRDRFNQLYRQPAVP